MAGDGLWNSNWLVENTQRAYPLRYSASATDSTSAVRIPDNFICAAQLVTRGYNPVKFFISGVTYMGNFIVVTISNQFSDSTVVDIGTVTVPIDTPDFTVLQIKPNTAASGKAAGNITIGSLETILNWPTGVFTFLFDTTALEFDVCRPTLDTATSIQIWDGDAISGILTGDVILRSGANIQLGQKFGSSGTVVTISAVNDPNFNDNCDCQSAIIGPPIRQINGVSPDINGNIEIVGSDCIAFNTGNGSLSVANSCASPCCGCDQLDAVFVEIKRFVDGAADLRDYANRLRQAIDKLDTIVLVSDSVGNCPQVPG